MCRPSISKERLKFILYEGDLKFYIKHILLMINTLEEVFEFMREKLIKRCLYKH